MTGGHPPAVANVLVLRLRAKWGDTSSESVWDDSGVEWSGINPPTLN